MQKSENLFEGINSEKILKDSYMDTINKLFQKIIEKQNDDYLLQCIKIIKEALIMQIKY